MDRRQFLAASTVGLTAAVAGCVGSSLSNGDPGSGSATNESAGRGEITVSANGEVQTEPDQAIVTIGVEASGESADAVTDELAAGAKQLRTTFERLGIAEENVEEGQFSISPIRKRSAEGFRGTHTFEVTLTDVDRVGDVIDAAIESGADDVGYVNFTLREETQSELRKEALDAALANADEEAAYIADNREIELQGTTAVTTGDVSVNPVRRETTAGADAAGEEAPPTEIDAEPVSVTASVTVTYSFAA
ncbi:SIMPL domain-containing protein [Natrinema halophilum]|uniref:SIMPL domain-containing protein n=1 Tax=Natrinema halophilum TaxID=1699371 RepID=A0A7D5L051_9EURY|nr:SIMPL domain-containing protein [Natrinema halophilum]QLG50900.1 SIMPL domain-containing protein [Natrinema halophilum]